LLLCALIGCSNASPQPAAPIEFSKHLPAAAIAGTRAGTVRTIRSRSWMQPGAKAKNLLYVSDYWNDAVYVFEYPLGKLVGELTGFSGPNGECVDNAGNVWITNTLQSQLLEYAHGGSRPIATLNDPQEYPIGCAVDPSTGNLAVTDIYGSGSPSLAAGNFVIYQNAEGSPAGPYYDSLMYYMYFCGYDAQGDLFFDGESYGGQFRLAELPSGSSNIVDISLNQTIGQPGAIQSEGSYVAVGDQQSNVIDHVYVSGSSGMISGSTPLGKAKDVVQFWIRRGKVAGSDALGRDVGLWKYPAGGSPTSVIKHKFLIEPIGAAVSPSK
jgi:DNA-binding beta-propeller fold protein YncE